MKRLHTLFVLLIALGCWINIADAQTVRIPDANLAAVVRDALGLAPNATITRQDMQRLTFLDAQSYKIEEITGQRGTIKDLTGLEPATQLTRLWLHNNSINDIRPLAGLTQLEELGIWNNQITDITTLARLTQLQSLSIAHNPIDNFQPLARLTQLRRLNITVSRISDIRSHVDLTQLESLEIGGTGSPISDLHLLGSLTQLSGLTIRNAQISDLSFLRGLTQLKWLNLGYNQISGLQPLTGLTQLEGLVLGDNEISDLKPLAGLTQLEELFLLNNRIRDVSPLEGLINLKNLYLSNNPIQDASPLANLPNLRNTDIPIPPQIVIRNEIPDELPEAGKTLKYRVQIRNAKEVTGFSLTYSTPHQLTTVPSVEWFDRVNHVSRSNHRTGTLTASGLETGQQIHNVVIFTLNATSSGEGELRIRGQLTTTQGRVNVDIRHPITIFPADNTGVTRNTDTSGGTAVAIPDRNLAAAVRKALGLGATATITDQAMKALTRLDATESQIKNLTGLEHATHLTHLDLYKNQIRDVSPLAGLVNLKTLKLSGNPIQDTSPLESLTKLREVDIDIHQKSVPATGTWLAVEQPSGLSAANFVIKPGTFAIFAHKNQPSVSQPADFNTYRLRSVLGAADFPNLADFFQNGGRIELVSHLSLNPLPPHTREPEFGDVVISEIMWGLNGSNQGKQYIELYNASADVYTFTNGDLIFRFSTAAEAPLPDEVFPLPINPNVRVKVIDRVSNKGWKVPGKSGNISQNQPLISMYRTIDYTTGDTPDGTRANSWKASTERLNLPAPSYGTPGAKHLPPTPVVHVGLSERPPMYWVGASPGTLHRLVGDEVENLVPTVKNATSLAVDMVGGKFYWTEKTSDRTGRVRRANLDGTNVQLVKNLTSGPHSIALDPVNRKLYLTNAWGKIQRLDLDGSNFQSNLIRGLESPRHLVLDGTSGKVYWTETTEESGRIRRANLNGSSVQNIVTNLAEPLTLAVIDGKLYWTNRTRENTGELQRANLDGTNSEVLETLPLAPTGIAVDTERNSLYLTLSTGDIHRRTLDGSGDEPVVTGLVAPSSIVLGITATTPGPTDAPEPPVTPVVDAATDVNKDQKVNKTDLLLVVTALGESPPANPNFDVNADGSVNIADVLLVIEALDDPVAAAAPTLGETGTSLDPAFLTTQIDILRTESDGSMKYEHAIAFFQSLLASIRPTETQLLANYPNPFNPETSIPYQLATDSNVRITIYDARGSVVRVLTLGHQSTGYYTSRSRAAYWDGRNALRERVASGVYFYQLQADDRSQMRKMLILK